MRLEINESDGKQYIRIVESVSVKDSETGKRKTKKKILKVIGPVSKFTDGQPDYVERLKASFEACDPLIEELRPYVSRQMPKETYLIKLFEDSELCVAEPKLCASLLLEKLLEELGIDQLIRTYKNHYGIDYDVYGFIKNLLFGRLLKPASKIATVAQSDDYYEPLIKNEFCERDVYKALDFIYAHKDALFNRINNAMVKKFGRTTNYVYYDVTNFFFETDEPDEDGLRRCGVSKEHRKTPIVQMGLLMDEQGIPVSVEAFPGNTLDHQTLQKSFDSASSCLKDSRYIYVCDKGIGRGDNFGYAVASGNGYLTSKSVRSSSKAEKQWILDPEGYIFVGQDFKYKSKVIVRDISKPDGTKIKVSEKILTYWSRQYFEREKAEKQSFYDTVEQLLAAPESFRVTKTQCSYFKKYLKKDVVNAVTGEAVDAGQLMAVLDMDKIKAEYDLLGYYTLVTSETRMEDRAIIDTYKNLVEIEDQFRVMKSTLETRPVFVRTPEHITAHLAVCAIALIMLRLIQRQVKLTHPETVTGHVFSVGMSADRIQTALCRWQVEKLDEVYYRFCNLRDPDLKLILDSFGLHIPLKCFQIGEIKHLKQLMFLSM